MVGGAGGGGPPTPGPTLLAAGGTQQASSALSQGFPILSLCFFLWCTKPAPSGASHTHTDTHTPQALADALAQGVIHTHTQRGEAGETTAPQIMPQSVR